MTSKNQALPNNGSTEHYDAVIIGAGVSGMYALYHLRKMGLSVRAYDGASDVGGTWWYNRYPGARVDGPGSPFYCYTFTDELMKEWDWTETQSAQPDVLAYLEHVADRFDLRSDIQFETWVQDAQYDEAAQRWTVETSTGVRASAQYLICAVGALSTANMPDIPGINDFAGETYHTGQWPHEPVSFEGKRVAVIGTGSSGIQAIPEIAKEAAHVTVLQRTAQYAFPAGNRALTPDDMAKARKEFDATREKMIAHPGGFPVDSHERMAMDYTPEERRARYEELWQRGSFMFFLDGYNDVATSEEANASLADFVRDKIRGIVKDKETADKLMPDHFVMTKRPILDNGYFETYNRDNVTLVDLREEPIERFTETSVVTASGEYPIDMLVLATGFDAISGSMLRLNPQGRDGIRLEQRWSDRFHNYLGLTINGFPNLFMLHGPGSPGVFYNMPLGAERQMDWVGNCVNHLKEQGMGAVEPTTDSEKAWGDEVNGIASFTLFPRTDSWWTGANIPGKPRYFSAYLGGSIYYQRISDVAAGGYAGFEFEKAHAKDDV
ncbi:MAG: cation diffusion facilitator CzcD-associated flavoprotein CzcO [Myxococcota bacterium]|jgi:cation diffusion facilitator CzcD-associated flavoprotein CzcO